MNTSIFQKGKCLNCDTPISTGILCLKCTPPASSETVLPREVMISEMQEGDSGFTEEYAVFEADSQLFLIGSARIAPQSEGYKTTRVRLRKGRFEVDSQTIDRDDIWLGWPNMGEETKFFVAKLV